MTIDCVDNESEEVNVDYTQSHQRPRQHTTRRTSLRSSILSTRHIPFEDEFEKDGFQEAGFQEDASNLNVAYDLSGLGDSPLPAPTKASSKARRSYKLLDVLAAAKSYICGCKCVNKEDPIVKYYMTFIAIPGKWTSP